LLKEGFKITEVFALTGLKNRMNSSPFILSYASNAPHPNAARVFINWFLSRNGQSIWQIVMNTKVQEPSDSMRIDIPKDNVSSAAKREEGRKYRVTGFLDPDPPAKMFQELLIKDKRK